MVLFPMSILKACVHYFLSNFYFSPNDSPFKTMKSFLFYLKSSFPSEDIFLYFHLPLFFFLSAIALEIDQR